MRCLIYQIPFRFIRRRQVQDNGYFDCSVSINRRLYSNYLEHHVYFLLPRMCLNSFITIISRRSNDCTVVFVFATEKDPSIAMYCYSFRYFVIIWSSNTDLLACCWYYTHDSATAAAASESSKSSTRAISIYLYNKTE